MKNDLSKAEQMAGQIREFAAEIFNVDRSEKIILVPGIANALEILLAKLGCESLLLTDEEYYDERTSPLENVLICRPEDVIHHWRTTHPSVILMSTVSWRGRVLPVQETFQTIAKERKTRRSILIADYSHAGAIGFPDLSSSSADIVCGDLAKWIIPPDRERNVAFLWSADNDLQQQMDLIFRKYYLATSQPNSERVCRWIEPSALLETVQAYLERSISKEILTVRYHSNRDLAAQVAKDLGIDDIQSCIVWSPTHVEAWNDERLSFWNTDGGTRIICRADIRGNY